MAKGISPFISGQGAAYINGMAGQLAARKMGESFIATDLIDAIFEVLPKI